jgi:hypothetical protein
VPETRVREIGRVMTGPFEGRADLELEPQAFTLGSPAITLHELESNVRSKVRCPTRRIDPVRSKGAIAVG